LPLLPAILPLALALARRLLPERSVAPAFTLFFCAAHAVTVLALLERYWGIAPFGSLVPR